MIIFTFHSVKHCYSVDWKMKDKKKNSNEADFLNNYANFLVYINLT